MTAYEKFVSASEENNSALCVGIDPDPEKLPEKFELNGDGFYRFSRQIIESCKDQVAAFKINFAFFEAIGYDGHKALKQVFEAVPPEIATIADAKRGDIGNSSKAYAKGIFEYFNADSVTISPYMGEDSVRPFLDYPEKFVFLLGLTSNSGCMDFQKLNAGGKALWQQIIANSSNWDRSEKLGYVAGATHPEELVQIREIVPDRLLLIPGIGAQGGNLEKTVAATKNAPFLINVSRSIIYSENPRLSAREFRGKIAALI